jgi:hypothetical protein
LNPQDALYYYLSGLASRPFLLNKIAFSLPALKQLNHINSTSLYQALIEDTLRRDDEKHVLSLRHKKTLLQDLAYYLWQNKEQVLPIDDLNDWYRVALMLIKFQRFYLAEKGDLPSLINNDCC